MKIAICGLVKSENLGEEFIARSLAWIIASELKEKGCGDTPEFVYVDLKATNDHIEDYSSTIASRKHNLYKYSYLGIPADYLHLRLKKVANSKKSLQAKNRVHKIRHWLWRHARNLGKRYRRYFAAKFSGVDIIVIDGAGLLEYSYNAYQEALNLITLYAEEKGIPVVFNAIGRAGEFDPNDYRCQVLVQAFQRSCVKYVSARDSQESVQECVGNRFAVKLLADAAFCVDQAYQVSKKSNVKLVGIGCIRGDASLSYSTGFGKEDWITLFCEIASELQRRGFDYEFFTNGAKEDYEIGKEVVSRLGVGESQLVRRPIAGRELLETISKYSGIITCRMHSSIAAFSLGIPSIILSWNDKVNKYMSIVGYPERAIDQQAFISHEIVDKLVVALDEGVSVEKRDLMKNLARESVKDYIDLLYP